jgi:hypothetical protein
MPDKASILIVDDRPEKLLALEAVLEDLNQHIVRAYSGREALRHVLDREFAVILLDVNMPGMDGFETGEPHPPAQQQPARPDHLHHRVRRRDARRPRATSSARSTTSSRRSCRRCCGRRWRCSSTCSARASRSSGRREPAAPGDAAAEAGRGVGGDQRGAALEQTLQVVT